LSAGGDSLQALSAAARLSSECALDVGVQDLLDHPSAAGMVALIEARRHTGTATQPEATLVERDAPAPVPAALLAGAGGRGREPARDRGPGRDGIRGAAPGVRAADPYRANRDVSGQGGG